MGVFISNGDAEVRSEGLHQPGIWGSSHGAGQMIRPERVVIWVGGT